MTTKMTTMTTTTKIERRRTADKLEKNFEKQLRLLAEMAAAYHHEGRPVPPEVGEAIGAAEHRRRAYRGIRDIFIEARNGPGVKTIIKRFLADVDRDDEAMKALLALHSEETA